jgi:hypothetical protein
MVKISIDQLRETVSNSPEQTKIYNDLVSKHGKQIIPRGDECCSKACAKLNETIDETMLAIAWSEATEGKQKKQDDWHKKLDVLASHRSDLRERYVNVLDK